MTSKSKIISMKFNQRDLTAIKKIARKRRIGISTLIRMWVVEKINKEGNL